MKKIGIITATRAEYGLLYPLIKALKRYECADVKVELIVTGTHLVKEFGETINDIIADGVRVDIRVNIPVISNSNLDIAKNQSEILRKFAELFDKEKYDIVVLLGDRYETLMLAIAAYDLHIPIFHLYGGDTTEGAIDEAIRHSITKMSYIHFPTNEDSRRRIIQLGEDPDRVFNFGATGTDNVLRMEKLSKEEALKSVGLSDCRYALCTYHPVTLNDDDIENTVMDFIEALCEFPQLEFIITKSNADKGGSLINSILDREEGRRDNIHVFASLGIKRYLSLMKYATAVIGNSSSGIMETPAFQIPTVNIGDRQKGRLQATNILNCSDDKNSIIRTIEIAISKEFADQCKKTVNPYGDGRAGEKIADKMIEILGGTMNLKKSFYNM